MSNKSIKVLLVEDELGHAKLVMRAFRNASFENKVLIATTLQEARVQIYDNPPDLVICDLVLPDGRGTELIPKDARAAGFPIVMLTAQGSESDAVQAMKAGALDYLVKDESVLADTPRVAERTLREWSHIQDLRRAEANLQAAMQLFRDILDSQPMPVAVLDRNGMVVTTNMTWQQVHSENALFGTNCCQGQNYLQFCEASPNSYGAKLAAATQTVLEGREPGTPVEHSCEDGKETRWYELIVRPFTGRGVAQVVVMHQEITHRKLAETEAVARANALGTINQLTPREAEVMRLVVRGEPNKKIARILDISVKTVEMHRSNLMKKLSVNSVPELVRMAVLAFPEWRVPEEDPLAT